MRDGDSAASNDLIPVIYTELRRIAARHLRRERREHTLQPTALVNEAYLRLFDHGTPHFSDRAHFMALATRVMRAILVDHARARAAAKRGGEGGRVTLDTQIN